MVTALCSRKRLCSCSSESPTKKTWNLNYGSEFVDYWSTERLLQYILEYCHVLFYDSLIWKAEPREAREAGASPAQASRAGLVCANCLRIFHWKGLHIWLQHKSFPCAVKFNSTSIPLYFLGDCDLHCCSVVHENFDCYLSLKLFLLSLQILGQMKDENQTPC